MNGQCNWSARLVSGMVRVLGQCDYPGSYHDWPVRVLSVDGQHG